LRACLWAKSIHDLNIARSGRRHAPLHRETAIAEASCSNFDSYTKRAFSAITCASDGLELRRGAQLIKLKKRLQTIRPLKTCFSFNSKSNDQTSSSWLAYGSPRLRNAYRRSTLFHNAVQMILDGKFGKDFSLRSDFLVSQALRYKSDQLHLDAESDSACYQQPGANSSRAFTETHLTHRIHSCGGHTCLSPREDGANGGDDISGRKHPSASTR